MGFPEKYYEFLKQLERKVPEKQFKYEVKENPRINPGITPQPRNWFLNSFEWYIGINLIPGQNYGPFFKVGGEDFWPIIGNAEGEFSETHCFWGLKKPVNKEEAERLYKMQDSTPRDYVYYVEFQVPENVFDAYLFAGAVKGGEGYQINPNSRVVQLVRREIVEGKVKKYDLK